MSGKVYVYFVQVGQKGPIKIGIARRVSRRIEALQIGNPEELRLAGSIECENRMAAEEFERHLHWLFRRHHIRGEWFSGKIKFKNLREPVIPVYASDDEEQIELVKQAIAAQ